MRTVISAFLALGLIAVAQPVFAANPDGYSSALGACRTEAARQLGVDAKSLVVKYDRIKTRAKWVEARLKVEGAGAFQCKASKSGGVMEAAFLDRAPSEQAKAEAASATP